MKIEIDSVYKSSGLIIAAVAIIFGCGAWATEMAVTARTSVVTQQKILISIDKQTDSIKDLTKILSEHEARIRVNETRIKALDKHK